MKYAELKADNERLRTQLADLVNAVEALRREMDTKRAERREAASRSTHQGVTVALAESVIYSDVEVKLAAILKEG